MLKETDIEKSLYYMEPGPVVLVTSFDGKKKNVMTISWTGCLDFSQHFSICTGPWNHSFDVIMKTKECVLAIPPAGMSETVVRIGDISGTEIDKFKAFGLTGLKGKTVRAPLIKECMANIECRVTDYVEEYGLIILEALHVWENPDVTDRRLIHAFADGTFSYDGERVSHRELMADKLPPGL